MHGQRSTGDGRAASVPVPSVPSASTAVRAPVPGECLTDAYTTLSPFDRIQPEVVSGAARAGLLIHEGQLTYGDDGLAKCLDLGEWWLLETGLPLPLGVNTARRDLGPTVLHELSEILRE